MNGHSGEVNSECYATDTPKKTIKQVTPLISYSLKLECDDNKNINYNYMITIPELSLLHSKILNTTNYKVIMLPSS